MDLAVLFRVCYICSDNSFQQAPLPGTLTHHVLRCNVSSCLLPAGIS